MTRQLQAAERTGGAWRALAAAGLACVALGAADFSSASFTSRKSNAGASFAAGTLSVLDSKAGSALVTVNTLRPGKSAVGTLNIQNTGTVADTTRLAVTSIVDNPASPGLSSALRLTVVDTTGGASTTLYNSGTLSGAGAVSLGTFAVSQTKSYSVTVSMATTPVDPTLQGAQSSFVLAWQAST